MDGLTFEPQVALIDQQRDNVEYNNIAHRLTQPLSHVFIVADLG